MPEIGVLGSLFNADNREPVVLPADAVIALLSARGGDDDNIDRLRQALTGASGRLAVLPAAPGASEVKAARIVINNSSTRATVATPTSGTAIRMLYWSINAQGSSKLATELYFGTGANIGTTAGKEIKEGRLNRDDPPLQGFPADGAGQVGAVDDVLSFRITGAVAEDVYIIVLYREE